MNSRRTSVVALLSALAVALVALPRPAGAEAGQFSRHAAYEVCFTPRQDCEDLIANLILRARSEVLVQAYSFTSKRIAGTLAAVRRRGIVVRVILDGSNRHDPFSVAGILAEAGIPVLIDDQVAIAHNKVIVVDRTAVLTGSANFTPSAQHRNAENVLLVQGDRKLAAAYVVNWEFRAAQASPLGAAGGAAGR